MTVHMPEVLVASQKDTVEGERSLLQHGARTRIPGAPGEKTRRELKEQET